MQVKLSDDGTKLEKVGWEGEGCSISRASISIMTQMLEGKSLDEFAEVFAAFRKMMDNRGHELTEAETDILEDAAAFQGVSKFPARVKCALLGWMALRDAADRAASDKGEK